MLCPLCSSRPAKRQCPAVNQSICTVCCGTKRLVEIRCPDDCVYLASARRHPAASVQRQHELDVALLLPAMSNFTDRQSRFFFLFQSIALRHPADALRPLLDSDIAEAAAATASTLETASRGVIYEQAPTTLPAQELSRALGAAFEEIVQQVQGPTDAPRERCGQGVARDRGSGPAGGADRRRYARGFPGARAAGPGRSRPAGRRVVRAAGPLADRAVASGFAPGRMGLL